MSRNSTVHCSARHLRAHKSLAIHRELARAIRAHSTSHQRRLFYVHLLAPPRKKKGGSGRTPHDKGASSAPRHPRIVCHHIIRAKVVARGTPFGLLRACAGTAAGRAPCIFQTPAAQRICHVSPVYESPRLTTSWSVRSTKHSPAPTGDREAHHNSAFRVPSLQRTRFTLLPAHSQTRSGTK
jgi:hypothetical protein